MTIEEQIGQHARGIALSTGRMSGAYRVNPADFQDVVLRLGAKVYEVAHVEPVASSPPVSLTMWFGALALTLAPDESVQRGEIRREESGL